MTKKIFYLLLLTIMLVQCRTAKTPEIMSVNGPVYARDMGISLVHEHILVDFIGADSVNYGRWDRSVVIKKALPYLLQAKELGCITFFECTPAYLGRDPLLLKALSDSTGLNIITNTGYYGAGNDKFIPQHAYTETDDELAARWIDEWENGIEGTGIKPGFIKIGVGKAGLSELHRKLVRAAAKTHLLTGLTIASHTGPAIPAFEQLDILKEEGVAAEAFIWVHAQTEKNLSEHVKAALMGAWISLDGLNENNAGEYLTMIKNLRDNELLERVLLSHDAGWYDPAKENGGQYRGYSTLFDKLIPLLNENGFSKKEIDQLIIKNPAKAYAIGVDEVE